MSRRRKSYLDEGFSGWTSYLRYLILIIPSGLWWISFFSLRSGVADITQYYSMEKVAIAFIILISAFLVNYGSRNFGISSLSTGFGAYFSSIYITFAFPEMILQEAAIQNAMVALMIFGVTLILLGIVSIAMWLSSHVFARSSLTVRLYALAIAATSVLAWFWFVTIPASITNPTAYIIGLPSSELLLYVVLIITSSFFVPRRQGVTIFYFLLGLIITLYGINLYDSNQSWLTPFYFPIFLSIGSVLIGSTALPLGTGESFSEHHPEHSIYVALTLWYILEILLYFNYPISYGRVIAISAIVMVAAASPRLSKGYIAPITCLLGAILYAYGNLAWIAALLFPQLINYNPFVSLAEMVIGMGLFLCSLILIGASLRHIFDSHMILMKNRRPLGWLLIIAGFGLLYITGLYTIFLYYIELSVIALVAIGTSIKFKRKEESSGIPFFMLVSATLLMMFLASASIIYISLESVFLSYYYTGILFIIMTGVEWKASESGEPVSKKKRISHKIVSKQTSGPEITGGYTFESVPTIPEKDSIPSEMSPPEQVTPIDTTEEPVSKPQFAPEEPQADENDEERMARTWYNRAIRLFDAGEIDEAIKSADTALTWKSDHEGARQFRKWLLKYSKKK